VKDGDYYVIWTFDGDPNAFLLAQFTGTTHALVNGIELGTVEIEGQMCYVTQEIGYVENNTLFIYEKELWEGKWSADWKSLQFQENMILPAPPFTLSFPVVVVWGLYDADYNWMGTFSNPYSNLLFTRQSGVPSPFEPAAKTSVNRKIRPLTQAEKSRLPRTRNLSKIYPVE
jgi:hypothetical protein